MNTYYFFLPFMSCIKFYKTHTKPLNCGIETSEGLSLYGNKKPNQIFIRNEKRIYILKANQGMFL